MERNRFHSQKFVTLKRIFRRFLKVALWLLGLVLVVVIVIFIYSKTLDFSLTNVNPDETVTQEIIDENNRRSEGRSYFSFPEWYIVYSAQEYADFLKQGGHASDFPNIASIEQFWQSVDGIKKATEGKYKINDETETVIKTIGYSFTFEYGVVAVYESTIGRVTQLLNFSKKSPEDIYNEDVAFEYGQFLNQIPWYEFPYFEKLKGLWTEAWGINSFWVRGIERRIILTVNYAAKGTYAAIVKKVTRSSFEVAEYDTEFVVKNILNSEAQKISGLTITSEDSNGLLSATSTRYRAFTKVAGELIEKKAQFQSIEKNNSILLSVVATDSQKTCIKEKRHIVFNMPILTSPLTERLVIVTRIVDIDSLVTDITECNTFVEHFYDY